MKTHLKLLYLFLLPALACCKKKDYPPGLVAENEAVFYASFQVDSRELKLSAVGDYYMFSSYRQDTNNVYNFIAQLRRSDCVKDCPASLRIQLNHGEVSLPGAPVSGASLIRPGLLEYVKGADTDYQVQFASSYNQAAQTYLWDFGDGSTSADAQPLHTYTLAGTYQVCLRVQGKGGCVSTICNPIEVGKPAAGGRIRVSSRSGYGISFEALVSGQPPYAYEWQFGDGKTSTLAQPTHVYAVPGAYPVSLKLLDAAGKTALMRYNAITLGDTSSCASNAWVSAITPMAGADAKNLSKVEVSWTDEQGVLYTSGDQRQPSTSRFEVVSAEDYSLNELGQKTKKLLVRFDCMLYNQSGASVSIKNAEAVICIAYP